MDDRAMRSAEISRILSFLSIFPFPGLEIISVGMLRSTLSYKTCGRVRAGAKGQWIRETSLDSETRNLLE